MLYHPSRTFQATVWLTITNPLVSFFQRLLRSTPFTPGPSGTSGSLTIEWVCFSSLQRDAIPWPTHPTNDSADGVQRNAMNPPRQKASSQPLFSFLRIFSALITKRSRSCWNNVRSLSSLLAQVYILGLFTLINKKTFLCQISPVHQIQKSPTPKRRITWFK